MRRLLAWAVLSVSMMLPASAFAEQALARAVNEEHPGYHDFRKYCASCHGVFGDGNGPVAPVLKQRPADLTQLGAKYGMPLPRNKLLPFIDGRDAMRAHGTREMPVWGDQLFENLPGSQREAAVRSTIIQIIDYLESIQPKADADEQG